jgi:hypothetical protein
MKKRKVNKAKRVDHTCRNNGTCDYCKGSRLHQAQKAMVSASQQEDYVDGWNIDVAQYRMEDR